MNKFAKRIFPLLMAGMLLLALVACGGGGTSTPASTPAAGGSSTPAAGGENTPAPVGDPIVLRWATTVAASEVSGEGTKSAFTVFANTFKDEIEARSGGRITVQFFPDGQLAKSTEEIVGGLQNGAFDLINLANGSWGEYTNALAPINVPYLYSDYAVVHAMLDSEIGEKMKQQVIEETGVVPLGYIDIGFRHITNSRGPIKTPDDLKGLKIRTMNDDIQMASMEAMGAAVTPIPFAELFTALQQKLVDAQENPVSNIYSQRYYEVQDYMTLTGHSYTATVFAISKDKFDAMSAEDQAMLQEVVNEAQAAAREYLLVAEEELLTALETEGMEVYKPTMDELQLFRDKAQTAWAKVEEIMGTEAFNELKAFVEKTEKDLGLV